MASINIADSCQANTHTTMARSVYSLSDVSVLSRAPIQDGVDVDKPHVNLDTGNHATHINSLPGKNLMDPHDAACVQPIQILSPRHLEL